MELMGGGGGCDNGLLSAVWCRLSMRNSILANDLSWRRDEVYYSTLFWNICNDSPLFFAFLWMMVLVLLLFVYFSVNSRQAVVTCVHVGTKPKVSGVKVEQERWKQCRQPSWKTNTTRKLVHRDVLHWRAGAARWKNAFIQASVEQRRVDRWHQHQSGCIWDERTGWERRRQG